MTLEKLRNNIPQIRIIANDINKGVSYSRNVCINNALGKYVWFVDPDDMLCPDIVKKIYNYAEENEADCVLGDYYRFSDLSDLEDLNYANSECICKKSDALPTDKNGKQMCSVTTGIFSLSFLRKSKLLFNEKMIAQEDTLFYWQLKLANPNRYKCDAVCYLYRQRSDSVMHIHSSEKNIKYYLSMREMLSVYQSQLEIVPEENKEELLHKISHSHQNVAATLAFITDTKYVKKQIRALKKNKLYPYKFRWSLLKGKRSFLTIIYFLLPIEIVFWLLHLVYKLYVIIRGFNK